MEVAKEVMAAIGLVAVWFMMAHFWFAL